MLAANENDADPSVEDSFRAAIRLNPYFAPAYDGLAEYECSHQEHLDEAQTLEAKAASLDPAELSYAVHMADVLAARHDFAAALQVLSAAADRARSPEEVQLVADHRHRAQTLEAEAQEERDQAENEARQRRWRLATETAPQHVPLHATEKPHGRMHYVHGVLRHVACRDPLEMELTLETGARRLPLYTNDWYSTQYEVANFMPRGDIHPCDELEGMKAEVEYFATADKAVDGQIVTILLFK